MSDEKIYVGRVQTRENKFGEVETNISFGPQDWEKLGINCTEWKNLVMKTSKEGKPYLQVNNWKPNAEANTSVAPSEEKLPF